MLLPSETQQEEDTMEPVQREPAEPIEPRGPRRFRDRIDAGAQLSGALSSYAHRPDVVVLALPRGGVPVGLEVARALGAPLDLMVVRKLGTPGQPELAMGAIASGGVRVLNPDVTGLLGLSDEIIDAATETERRELERRERAYRGDRPPPALAGRTVILVDDGVATGSTLRAAARAARAQHAGRLVIAAPVAAARIARELGAVADEVVCVSTPEELFAISMWYDAFPQVTDDEVRALLARAPGASPRG